MATYLAADGKSGRAIQVDRGLGDALVRAGILIEAPVKVLLPNEQAFDEDGIRHRRQELPQENEARMSIGEFKDGAPYLMSLTGPFVEGRASKEDYFSGADPDKSGVNWPADLVADYRRRWQAYQESL